MLKNCSQPNTEANLSHLAYGKITNQRPYALQGYHIMTGLHNVTREGF